MYDEEISENESVKALHNEIEVTEKAFESDSDSDDDYDNDDTVVIVSKKTGNTFK